MRSARAGKPTDCSLTSYWSDLNDGTVVYGTRAAGSASRFAVAAAAVSDAVLQCSTATACPPASGCGICATSPAAATPSAFTAMQQGSHSTAGSSSSPEPASHSTFGGEPVA